MFLNRPARAKLSALLEGYKRHLEIGIKTMMVSSDLHDEIVIVPLLAKDRRDLEDVQEWIRRLDQ